MSRPRFLADEDVHPDIIGGVLRMRPALQLVRARDLNLGGRPDPEVLQYAADHGLIVVSHDSNTMTAHASHRIQSGLPMPGLIIIHQWIDVGIAIRELLTIWEASEAEEWPNVIDFIRVTT